MRDIQELYEIKGKQGYYSAEAVQGLKFFPQTREGYRGYQAAEDGVCKITNRTAKDEFNIIQADGSKKRAYGIGSYRWTYSKEERDRVREEEKKEREEHRHRVVMLDQILAHYEKMSTEDLEAIVAKL